MTQESRADERRDRDAPAKSAGKTLPDKRDCGPNVDSWPILDSQGRPIPDDEGKRSRS